MGNELVNYFEGNPSVRIAGLIYETDDYSMFKKLDGNRDVNKIGPLKKSMKKYGFMNCPIMINEKGEVAEGQHRVRVAKELGLPVKFTVQPGMGLDETITLNTGQKNWSVNDYLNSMVDVNENYARFKQLQNLFAVSNKVIYTAMGANVTGGGIEQVIKNGSLICTEEQYEEAIRTLKWVSIFNDVIKKAKTKGSKHDFYIALIFASRSNLVNVQTLTRRVIDNYFLVGSRFGNVEEMVGKIENAYNYKVAANNRIYLVDSYRKAADESLAQFSAKEKR